MRKFKLIVLFVVCTFLGFNVWIIQNIAWMNNAHAEDDAEIVNAVIDEFQDAYSSKNVTEVQNLFHHKAVVAIDFDAHNSQNVLSIAEWGKSTRELFKEKAFISDKLTNREIEIHSGSLATVVCEYDYRDPANHQAGIDIFTLMKIRGKWKIISLVFTGDSVAN